MRDTVAFHVDDDDIAKGLETLSKERPTVVLGEGEGSKSEDASLTIGLEALYMGSDMTKEDYQRFVAQVSEDHNIRDTVQEALGLALEAAHIPHYTESSRKHPLRRVMMFASHARRALWRVRRGLTLIIRRW
jgi:hypothetical protein